MANWNVFQANNSGYYEAAYNNGFETEQEAQAHNYDGSGVVAQKVNALTGEPLPVEQSRSCQCGSGQDWWNCSENSPYCG